MTDEDVALRSRLDAVKGAIGELQRNADYWRDRYEHTLARCRELLERSLVAERRASEFAVRASEAESDCARFATALLGARAEIADQRRRLANAIGFLEVRELPVIDAECETVAEGSDGDVS